MTMSQPDARSRGDVPIPLALTRGRLVSVLQDTARDIAELTLPLHVEGVEDQRERCQRLATRMSDQLLPRLKDPDVPAVVVIGGSTGAGKSTLVNSVLGREVSPAGVLRPTTRVPVLVVHPEDEPACREHPLAQVCDLVVSDAVPAGLALVDASDLDSVHEANRALAARLLEAADLWIFVTTAARYGDLTPWATLEEAAARAIPVAVVLNRAPRDILAEVRRDLLARVARLDAADAPFFVVRDAGAHEGLLEDHYVVELRQWLNLLAGRHRAAGLVRRTDRGSWRSVHEDLLALADAVDAQASAAAQLDARCGRVVADEGAAVREELEAGVAAEGAPATRWVSLASAGAPLAPLVHGGALRRGWRGRHERRRHEALELVAGDVDDVVVLTLEAAAARTGTRLRQAWHEAGLAELADEYLGRAASAGEVVAAWTRRAGDDPPSEGEATHAAPEVRLPAVAGLSERGVLDLVCAAAAGLAGARRCVQSLGLEEAADRFRDELVERSQALLASLVPAGAAATAAPSPDLAALLRVRAAEIQPLLRSGDER